MEFARKNVITTSVRGTYSSVGLLLKATLLSTLVAISGMAFAERDTSRDQYRHPITLSNGHVEFAITIA